jgi:Regulator of chromosome condensation (RCC1) repeat
LLHALSGRWKRSAAACLAAFGAACVLATGATAAVVPPDDTFTQVTAGVGFACGLQTNGGAVCWGDNAWGESTPPADDFKQISAGDAFACGLEINGTAVCWGADALHQTYVPSGPFTQVAAGAGFACGLEPDGQQECWGQNYWGTGPTQAFTSLSAGYYFACGLGSAGGTSCWADGIAGATSPPGDVFTQIAAGYDAACGLQSGGSAVCWGDDTYGESSPPADTFTQLAAGYNFACGLKSSGAAACWGDNSWGEATPPTDAFTQLSAGYGFACGLTAAGTAICWGDVGAGAPSGPASDEFDLPSPNELPASNGYNATPSCPLNAADGYTCDPSLASEPPPDPGTSERYVNSAYWPAEKRPDVEVYGVWQLGYDYQNCSEKLPHYCFLADAQAEGYPISHMPQVGDLWVSPCITWYPNSGCTIDDPDQWYMGYVEQVLPDGSFIQSWAGQGTADTGIELTRMSSSMDAQTDFIGLFPAGSYPNDFAQVTSGGSGAAGTGGSEPGGEGSGGGSSGSSGDSSNSNSRTGGGSPRSQKTAPQIKRALRAVMAELRGKSADLRAIRRADGFRLRVSAPEAGRLVIDWDTAVLIHHKRFTELVASARIRLRAAHAARVIIRLTPVGRRLFASTKALRIEERATFTPSAPKAARATTISRVVRLRR